MAIDQGFVEIVAQQALVYQIHYFEISPSELLCLFALSGRIGNALDKVRYHIVMIAPPVAKTGF